MNEDGRLLGLVALADVARGAALLGRREAEELVFQLLGKLSKPRARAARSPLAAE